MSARQAGPYDSIAGKWLALAERRRAYLIALRDSGRWRHFHYSGAAELDAQISELDLACARFAMVAGPEAADSQMEAEAAAA
jgi:hypothetical protein